jgi:NADPH:quinone reductase-like Zn-dependent oxidoreductase
MTIDNFGGPEVLHWADLPEPEPGPGEVRLRVAFAGVNPADCKTCRGMLARFFDTRFPFVLGFDLAGTVDAVGAGVTAWQPGDRVFGTSRQGQGANGSYAEYTTAYAAMLARVPDGVALSEAAAMPTAGTTAYGGLVDAGGLRAGQRVLIHGGAGGVGSIAIQIAKALGARVAVTCSAANADHVRGLGADLAIDYRTADVPTALRRWAPDGVDIALDAVGLDTLLPRATELVKQGGSYVEIETLESSASKDRVADAARQGVRIVSNMVAISRLHEHLAALAVLMSEGKVRMPALEIMPLGEAALAHERLARRQVRGKIVLEVGGSAK